MHCPYINQIQRGDKFVEQQTQFYKLFRAFSHITSYLFNVALFYERFSMNSDSYFQL